MESNDELIENLKKEVKDELKDKFNETAVGYIHVFNKISCAVLCAQRHFVRVVMY